jgi:hypothetical protein
MREMREREGMVAARSSRWRPAALPAATAALLAATH